MGPSLLGGHCLVKSVVYRAEVIDSGGKTETYIGLTSNTVKERFYGHRHSFKHADSESSATLSAHIWDLKQNNKNFNINWSVLDRAKSFNPVTRKCNLCVLEKYFIIFQPEEASTRDQNFLFVVIFGTVICIQLM